MQDAHVAIPSQHDLATASEPTRISSRSTTFYKYVFPFLLPAICFLMSLNHFFEYGDRNVFSFTVLFPLFLIPLFTYRYKEMFWDMASEVFDAGDSLVFKHRGKTRNIPISEFINVSWSKFGWPQRLTLVFRPGSAFGTELSFMPIQKSGWEGFALNPKSPIVEDLILRVDAARRAPITQS